MITEEELINRSMEHRDPNNITLFWPTGPIISVGKDKIITFASKHVAEEFIVPTGWLCMIRNLYGANNSDDPEWIIEGDPEFTP